MQYDTYLSEKSTLSNLNIWIIGTTNKVSVSLELWEWKAFKISTSIARGIGVIILQEDVIFTESEEDLMMENVTFIKLIDDGVVFIVLVL